MVSGSGRTQVILGLGLKSCVAEVGFLSCCWLLETKSNVSIWETLIRVKPIAEKGKVWKSEGRRGRSGRSQGGDGKLRGGHKLNATEV